MVPFQQALGVSEGPHARMLRPVVALIGSSSARVLARRRDTRNSERPVGTIAAGWKGAARELGVSKFAC